jgi:hypothetical protein
MVFFLFPLFFILHSNNENFGLLSLSILLPLFYKYCLVVIVAILISILVLDDRQKSIIFCSYILSIYFFFGAFHDTIKNTGSFLSSYTILLPAILGSILLLWFLLKKSARQLKFQKFIIVLLMVLTLLELTHLLIQVSTNSGKKNNLSGEPVALSTITCSNSFPDVYFIIFDGYTSSGILNQEFNYNNSYLDSALVSNGFEVAMRASSNYNVTPYSLSATLNLNYLKPGLESSPITSKDFLQAIETFKTTNVPQFFFRHGYRILNFGCFDLEGAPSPTIPYFEDFTIAQVDNQTLFSRIKRDIGFNFLNRKFLFGWFDPSSDYQRGKQYHLFRNEHNMRKLKEEIESIDSSRKFVYAHLMLPHEPFYLKEDGSFQPDSLIINNTIDLKEGYVHQVKYTNSLIFDLMQSFQKGIKKPKIVIIMGDHGYRFYGKKIVDLREFPILNSYHFPGGAPKGFNDSISPVNSFRLIFNQYFCQDLPYLIDSSIYIWQ